EHGLRAREDLQVIGLDLQNAPVSTQGLVDLIEALVVDLRQGLRDLSKLGGIAALVFQVLLIDLGESVPALQYVREALELHAHVVVARALSEDTTEPMKRAVEVFELVFVEASDVLGDAQTL